MCLGISTKKISQNKESECLREDDEGGLSDKVTFEQMWLTEELGNRCMTSREQAAGYTEGMARGLVWLK